MDAPRRPSLGKPWPRRSLLTALLAGTGAWLLAPWSRADNLPTPASPTLLGIRRRGCLRAALLTGSAPYASMDADADEVRALLTADPPPLHPALGGHRVVGLDADLAAAIAALLGVPLQILAVERFDALFTPLGSGEVDIALGGISRTAKRAMALAFSIPYLTSGHELFVLDEHRFQSLQDVNQPAIKVGVREGSTGQTFALRELGHAAVRAYASVADQFRALLTREIDACLAHGTVGRDYALRRKLTLYSVERRRLTSEATAIAARQGDSDFVEFLSLFIHEQRQTGEFVRLARRYNQWLRVDR